MYCTYFTIGIIEFVVRVLQNEDVQVNRCHRVSERGFHHQTQELIVSSAGVIGLTCALKLAHRGYVMVTGTITMSGTGKELLDNPQVQAAYLEGGRR